MIDRVICLGCAVVRQYNKKPHPFQWVATANEIVRKVNKYKETLETGD